MDPDKYFNGYNLKKAGRKKKFRYAKTCAIWTRIFLTLSPVAYITVDFKKLVSDLFHAGFDVL